MNCCYMVQRASGGKTQKEHQSFDKALKEAERLSTKTDGEVFYVLQVIGQFSVRVRKVGTVEPESRMPTDQIGWAS